KERWCRNKEPHIKTIVTALTIKQGNQLLKARGTASYSRESETTRSAIHQIAVAHQDAKCGSSRCLLGNTNRCFLNLWLTAIGPNQNADAQSLSRSSFPFFQPRAFNREGFSSGNALHMQRNSFDFRWLERVREKPSKNVLHREGDGKTVGRKSVAGRK